ncbi:uncharacterized protein [Antennarius striatus]|uniref:uncharacterized protein isoform X2 n=1 Tax=Antennarius striatus TaxID=241820 RepID=UPI0035AFBC69
MNIQHVLFLWVSGVLFDETKAGRYLYIAMEGDEFTADFQLPSGVRKYFCKGNCGEDEMIIETYGNRAKSDRYTVEYDTTDRMVLLTIKGLIRADEGLYRVGVSDSSSHGSYQTFQLIVRDLCDEDVVFGQPRIYNATQGGKVTISCSLFSFPQDRRFLCRDGCNKFLMGTNDPREILDRYEIKHQSDGFFNVTITSLREADSGWYRCGVARKETKNSCQDFEIRVTGQHQHVVVILLVVNGLGCVCILLLLFRNI